MEDPWTPQDPQGIDPNAFAQQFAFLDDPKVRSALLSTGIALMQPPSFGDTFPAQLGRAVGAGGESVQRQEAADLKQQEADSKAALREAQAGAAGARADTAGARADTATQRLALEREKMTSLNERNLTRNQMLGQRLYQNYVKDTNAKNTAIAKGNADVMRPRGQAPDPLLPILDPEDWMARNPLVKSLLSGAVGTPDAGTPGGDAVPPPESRQPGVYPTPKGDMRWTGTGWVKP